VRVQGRESRGAELGDAPALVEGEEEEGISKKKK